MGGRRLNGNAPNDGLITQRDVAKRLGVSRARAFQLEQSALRKIRKAILADPALRRIAIEVCGDAAIAEAETRKNPLYL